MSGVDGFCGVDLAEYFSFLRVDVVRIWVLDGFGLWQWDSEASVLGVVDCSVGLLVLVMDCWLGFVVFLVFCGWYSVVSWLGGSGFSGFWAWYSVYVLGVAFLQFVFVRLVVLFGVDGWVSVVAEVWCWDCGCWLFVGLLVGLFVLGLYCFFSWMVVV